jgi:hypothetical protein
VAVTASANNYSSCRVKFMASVDLWFEGRNNAVYDLPLVCMKCGAEATVVRKRQFSWYPPWIWVLFLLSVWPFIIVALILTKRATVEIPFCDKHKNHFLWRLLAGGAGVAVLVGTGVFGYSIAEASAPKNNGGDIFGAVCLIWFILLAVFALTVGVFNMLTTIRPTVIDNRKIRLTNVSSEFAKAFDEAEAEREDDIDREVRERWNDRRRKEPFEDERYERRGDQPPPRRSTDVTGEQGE